GPPAARKVWRPQSTSWTDLVVLEVGRVVKPHGLRGEVIVELTTDRTERMAPGTMLAAGPGDRMLLGGAARPHQNRWIVQFEGVHGREGADALRGTVLSAEP